MNGRGTVLAIGFGIALLSIAGGMLQQWFLYTGIGAGENLDGFFLTRSLPVFLEQTAAYYLAMAMLPRMVARRAGIGVSAGLFFRDRWIRLFAAALLAAGLFPGLLFLTGGRSAIPQMRELGLLAAGASACTIFNLFLINWFNARHRYNTPPCANLAGVLVTVSWLAMAPRPLSVAAAAWAMLAGVASQALIMLAAAGMARSAEPSADADTQTPPAAGGWHAAGTGAMFAFTEVADRGVSARLDGGSVAIFRLAARLPVLLHNCVFGTLTNSSRTLQMEAHALDPARLEERTRGELSLVTVLAVPLMAAVWFGTRLFLELVFQHGLFRMTDVAQTRDCVLLLTPTLLAVPLVIVLSGCFFARGRHRPYFWLATGGAALGLGLKLALLPAGLQGLAAAQAAAAVLTVPLFAAALGGSLFRFTLRLLFSGLALTALAVAPGALLVWALHPSAFMEAACLLPGALPAIWLLPRLIPHPIWERLSARLAAHGIMIRGEKIR